MRMRLLRDNDDPKLLADLERLARPSSGGDLEQEGAAADVAASTAGAAAGGSKRRRVRLVRDNDDPKLLADLERLAGGAAVAGTAAVAAEAVDADEGGAEEVEPGPLDDPFVRRFVQVSVHLKRYAPFYAGAAVWLLAMLLIQPVGRGGDTELADGPGFAGTSTVDVAPASADTAVADLNADAIGAPVFETVIGAAAFSEADSAFGDFSESEFSAGSSDTDASTTPTTFADETITFDDSEFGSDDEEGLTILRSGYASATGGTPLEQDPPAGALPVAVTLGNDSKRSFLELAGKGTTLRLKESPEGALRPEEAVLKACLATSEWEAERGQALDAGPSFDPACSTGTRAEGVWSFDLSNFPAEDLAKGLVLTAGPGTAHTFEVHLEPFALPDEGA